MKAKTLSFSLNIIQLPTDKEVLLAATEWHPASDTGYCSIFLA